MSLSRFRSKFVAAATAVVAVASLALADGTAFNLGGGALTQNWSDATLITANDNWSGVPSIIGYQGTDGTTTTAGVDPQTILAERMTVVDVIANQTNPSTNSAGGVAEFHVNNAVTPPVTDATVALQGSGTADSPFLLIHLNTLGRTAVNVAYNLRDIDGSADNAVQQVALQYRVGSSGDFTNLSAGYVADATTGPSLATLVTPVSVALPAAAENQPVVQVRIITTNAGGNDEWVGVDDINITSSAGTSETNPAFGATAATPGTVAEGETTRLTASVIAGTNPTSTNLTVTADLTAIGGSATQSLYDDGSNGDVAGSDGVYSYQATIANGTTVGSKTLPLLVTDGESRSGTGSISLNILGAASIGQIQGSGTASPLVGNMVRTTGIVTARRGNGFFIQTPDASVDADATTSEGLLIFTGSAPAADVQPGALVNVQGTVTEFRPGTNPGSMTITEITSPTTSVVSTGNALPAPITLTMAMVNPAGSLDQFERYEGMRVQGSFMATAGGEGNTTETSGNQSLFGDFHAVVSGVARPMREAGVSILETLPAGAPANIPRFDENPELMRVNTDGINFGYKLNDIAAGATMDIVGILEYATGSSAALARYTVSPTEPVTNVVSPSGRTASTAPNQHVSVASFNVERLFDTVADPNVGDPVIQAAYLEKRFKKLSLTIRNVLKTPDVLGLIEVENISILTQLATRINSDAVAAGEPDPAYTAHLLEGNDIGGIDVAFLLKSSRVSLVAPVEQINPTLTWADPGCTTNCPPELHDRPSLVAKVLVNNGTTNVPLTVVINHLRSLNGVDTDRTREKRKLQAEDIARWVDTRQLADPTEKIIMVGDFNAFEVNDGYVDVLNTIAGNPAPVDQVVKATDDLVATNLVVMTNTIAQAERYSFEFDGNAQALDHAIASANVAENLRLEYVRNNADFPESYRVNETRPERISDHDIVMVYYAEAKYFVVTVPAAVSSGVQFNATVTAYNTNGTVDTSYVGTISFDSSDATATLPTDYTFLGGDNGTQSFPITMNEVGSRTLTVTDTTTAATATTAVNVSCAAITVTASNNGPACSLGTASFDVSLAGASSYSWVGPNGFTATSKNPTRSNLGAADAGDYTVTVTLANGCTYDATTTLVVNTGVAQPAITAPASVSVSSTDNVASIAAVDGATYEWTLSGSTITSGGDTNSITFPAGPAGTTLELSVTVTLGDCSATTSKKVQTDFNDVPPTNIFRDFINTIARNGITAGCGNGNFCPGNDVTRQQMAVFLLVSKEGTGYIPPDATGLFGDVPTTNIFAKWIEELARRGITSGCGNNNYCPTNPVTRQQMAVLLLVTKEGSGYLPPEPVGIFNDVPTSNVFAKWIEELANRGITSGCGNGNYCPTSPVTRGQMAVFLTATFGLQ